jgi:acyl-CoA synthetase (AMP-forming)/AMP-acid ligase II
MVSYIMAGYRYDEWHDEPTVLSRITEKLGDDPSMATAFYESAQSQLDDTFLRFNGEHHTWSKISQKINSIASGLVELGVKKGDRVVLHAGHDPDFIATQFALYSIGAAMVPVHAPYSTAPDDFEYIVRDSASEVIIAQDSLAGVIEDTSDDAYETAISLGETEAEVDYILEEILSDGDDQLANSTVGLDDVAMHYYTSGTTGKPKGVIHNHRGLLAQGHQMTTGMDYDTDDRIQCHFLPTHVGNPVFELSAIYAGSGLNQLWPFEPDRAVEYLEQEEATVLAVVPTHVIKMLQHADMKQRELPALEKIAYGGAPMPFPRIQEIKKQWPGIELQNIYGMTEAAGALTFMKDEHALDKQGGVGGSLPGVELDVISEGESATDGEVGEVIANAPNIMREYWNLPEKTNQVLKDGWYHTGDLGHFDEEGILFIDGREDHLIIRGGENIYPPQIEDAITEHPGVAEAAVIGVPDDEYGERAKAFIVPQDGSNPESQEIIDYCSESLATFKLPEIIEFLDDLPRTPMEKIDKMELTNRNSTDAEYRTWDRQ